MGLLRRRVKLTRAQKDLKARYSFAASLVLAGVLGVGVTLYQAQKLGGVDYRRLSGGDDDDADDDDDGLCSHIMSGDPSNIGLPNPWVGGGATAAYYTFMTFWIFVGIAIICDEFFEPSLQKISDALGLSPDVAGATFLAAGSSAPELFTSTADAFGPAASVGIGTIIGSAMFNILIIVALSAAIAAQNNAALDIDWRPVTRDATFYTMSIILLGVFFWDAKIYWWEGAIMTAVYGLYIYFMTINEWAMDKMDEYYNKSKIQPGAKNSEEGEAALEQAGLELTANKVEAPLGDAEAGAAAGETGGTPPPDTSEKADEGKGGDDEDEEEREDWDRLKGPESKAPLDLLYWVLSYPFMVLFTFTIPDCAYPWFQDKFKQVYWVTFTMAILWIGLLCHYMVEFSLACACILGIPPILVGLLVLSVGTSVPDAIGSMIAARQGEANMAIANAIGSNVFDVLLGLGLPWFLAGVTVNNFEPTPVNKDGILTWVFVLLFTVALFVGVLKYNRWQMNGELGKALVAIYALFFIFVAVSPLFLSTD
jgi:K+-dependent Na+/Ca+ exchanger-like protein